jgi:hypothetical protein
LIKVNRYSKQRRLTLKRIKELNRREDQNILKLEIDKIMTEGVKISEKNGQFSVPGALNSFSLRSSFFITFVKEEGFTDLFFRFLDSPNRNTGML